ncbi:antitermination protein Q [Salmonella enterica]|uniref:Antitermination protein Q n=1 Tax=Salmonella diarizonae TaxID=59204 RepID=A0A6Y1UIB7_SALDZ|nr:antitermination protein Q [Salmonella enterica subsp. houtenae]EDQ2394207.1 antitermination protein Q [Salmonella enterica subsp. enterica]HAB4051762.1 antitermination protein Q [Salmonella enterica subsp. diarizonae]HCM1917692.1 antitermination protein Q [Salmonella enterica subsp. salamae serovar 28:r:e,n,z15]
MRRDMQEVLERWGRWAASEEYCSMVDWPSLSVLPQRLPEASGKPGCSDEDGIAIDSCIAQMSLVCPRDELLIVGLRFIGGLSTRAIAEVMQTDRNIVRKALSASEAFLAGCLLAFGITLDMDPEVRIDENLAGTRKTVLWL